MPTEAGGEGTAMIRRDKPKLVSMRHKATINEKLDDALDNSFPASDPVSLGHSDHVGQPAPVRRKVGKLPKGFSLFKGKR
jgi:hypothetical protein